MARACELFSKLFLYLVFTGHCLSQALGDRGSGPS